MNLASAMILAAGRGERMRPLTDHRPKPLLPVHGKPLLQWALEALARGGVRSTVVNTAWLGEQVSGWLGDRFEAPTPALPGEALPPQRSAHEPPDRPWFSCALSDGPPRSGWAGGAGLAIRYSHEGRDFGGALETAGGIVRALPLLDDPFWVLAGDVLAPEFAFSPWAMQRFMAGGRLAHIWLVPNPAHHPQGDFGLSALPGAPSDDFCPSPSPAALVDDASCPGAWAEATAAEIGLALSAAEQQFTFSGIGLYRKALFAPPYCDIPAGNPQGTHAPLAPILRAAMADARVTAELYTGMWTDVGTPQRLAELNQQFPDEPPTPLGRP